VIARGAVGTRRNDDELLRYGEYGVGHHPHDLPVVRIEANLACARCGSGKD